MADPGYSVWTGNGVKIIYSPYQYAELFGPEKYWDDRTVHTFFARHWSASVWLAIIYVATINLLQKFMDNRKPYKLVPFWG